MTAVPLGKGAYERLYAGSPLIQLVNRWLEANPANLREGVGIIARPGTTELESFSPGSYTGQWPMRCNYALNGLFGNDLFVVCGSNLYRLTDNGDNTITVTPITGTINGDGTPEVAWQAGIGYQRLWISDGTLLQYYSGLSPATGTLTVTGGTNATGTLTQTGTIVNGTDKFEVGGVYYVWGTIFSGSDAGTVGNPYVVNPTSQSSVLDPMNQLIKAINDGGVAGTDYSSTLTDNSSVNAIGDGNVPATVVTFKALTAGLPGAAITLSITGGTALTASGGGTLTYSGVVYGTDKFEVGGIYYTFGTTFSSLDAGTSSYPYIINPTSQTYGFDPLDQAVLAINGTGIAGTDYSNTITVPNPLATAADLAAQLAQQNGNTFVPPSTTITITAITPGTDGNSIIFTVAAGTALTASGSGTLTGGGLNILQDCPMPDNVSPGSITQVSSYVMVAQGNSQIFFWINPGATNIDPLNFASKESSPDPIVCMRAVGDQVMIMGAKSSENWYATGVFTDPFAPIEGRVYARGVVLGSPVVVDDGVFLVGDDGRVYSIGYQPGDSTDTSWGVNRVSNNGIEERVRYQIRRLDGLTP